MGQSCAEGVPGSYENWFAKLLCACVTVYPSTHVSKQTYDTISVVQLQWVLPITKTAYCGLSSVL